MFKRISNFINKHNILHSKQFGFRSKHSTLHAILSITDIIQREVEDGYYSCGIFLDLSKAFDIYSQSQNASTETGIVWNKGYIT